MISYVKSSLIKGLTLLLSIILSTSLTNPSNTGRETNFTKAGERFLESQHLKEKLNIPHIKYNNLPLNLPFDTTGIKRISSKFGEVRHKPRKYVHEGVDFAGIKGTPILSSGNGKVVYAGRMRGYGKIVKIEHENNIKTIYAHLSKINVSRGNSVTSGQVIGKLGNTGRSTGPHLHYEVLINEKAVDPLLFLFDKTDITLNTYIKRAITLKNIFQNESCYKTTDLENKS